MSDNQEHEAGALIKSERQFFVVGIGASAGGLNALGALFAHLPIDSGAAFVIIQHLSPNFKSLMKDLLQRHTDMTIYRVTEGIKLEPNSIYLIPPGKNLFVETDTLHLEERKRSTPQKYELNFPIDLFFESLAKNYREKAIGVVLSGSGSDGTRGLKAIAQAGGLALVQEPETAEFDGMPFSAIATGVADRVLPIPQLSRLIYQSIVSPSSLVAENSNIDLVELVNLKEIIKILIEKQNIDFSGYKFTILSRRIHRRCLVNNLASINEYIEILNTSVVEREILCSDLLINVTQFFRDAHAWENLQKNVLPLLIEQAEKSQEIRIWVTACSTGEEAYSIAILIDEVLEKAQKQIKVKIFATDLDRTALNKATMGIYPITISKEINSQRLHKYFAAKDNCFQVKRKLRKMILFSELDLTKDSGFTQIDLVICRNVLIYMQPTLQHRVLRNLHFALVSQGVLFLGKAETVEKFEQEFKTLDQTWKIYQKRRNVRIPIYNETASILPRSSFSLSRSSQQIKTESIQEQGLKRILSESNSIVLFVDQDHRLIHVCGDGSKVLKAFEGKVTTNITKMVISPLQLVLNHALHRAKRQQQSVFYPNIKLEEGFCDRVSLKVIPPSSEEPNENFLVVQITPETTQQSPTTPQVKSVEIDREGQAQVLELQQELQDTRGNLQILVEELEKVNEEQQTANEELTASNEELQSINEELHSVNEELHTVNHEYQSKIQELTELNNDIDNLLKSTDIGVIFLDSELKIRKFTPAATMAISLLEVDLERPIEDLSYKIDYPDLIKLLRQVLESKRSQELEVKLKQSDSYLLMKVNLYQTEDDLAAGIVLSFIKLDEIKKVQRELEATLKTLRHHEIELNKLNQELETRVKARTSELNQVNLSLQQEIETRQKTETRLEIRLQQQAAIATLGKQALAEIKLDDLFQQAVILAAQNLDVEYTKILELVKDGDYLLLRTGVGWAEGLVGTARVATNLNSQAGYALISKKPVIVNDLPTETRFEDSALLKEHEVVSGISIIIFGKKQPFGVLGAHTRQKRSFSQDDVNFLQAIANILATAINAHQNKQFLQASEKHFRAIFEQAAVGIAEVSLEGRFVRVNQRFSEIVGYSRDRFLTITFQEITHPDDLNTDLEYVRQLLTGEIETYSMEKRYFHQNGSIVWINLTASLVKNISGEPDYFIAVIEDISDRKETEIALEEIRKKLQQANQAKDSFLAHMSHELRTPLNSILGFSQILQKDPHLTCQQLESVNIVRQSGQHLLTLINDILDFSKIEAGKLQLEAQEFYLVDFLNNLVAIFSPRAQARQLTFDCQLSPSLPIVVKGDETRLRQVLFNLLSNAIKYTEQGGVIFKVSFAKDINQENTIANSSVNKTIRFQVEDSGIGIPRDQITRVFLPFEQLNSLKESHQEGTGLGLTITQNLLQLMGSQIQLESTFGKGSIFWFDLELETINSTSLPRVIQPQTQPQPQPIGFLGQPRKILVVDDNKDNRDLLVTLLQPLGFILEEANNGKTGLAKADVFVPDLILLDLVMPEMDGKEMAEKVRQLPHLQDVVIFMISANNKFLLQPEQVEIQCDAVLSKPVNLEQLLDLIETHLHLKKRHPLSFSPPNSNLIAPPREELEQLLILAKMGDIDAIEEIIQSLPQINPEYISFAQKLQSITETFQQYKLIKFIEQFLSN